MVRYVPRASLDVFLCSLRSSCRADTGTYPMFCFTVRCGATMKWTQENTLGFIELYEKCLFCGIRTIPNIITNYTNIFPPGAANNWWITACSLLAGMRTVLSKSTPQVEQNPALLCYAVTLWQIAQVWTWPKVWNYHTLKIMADFSNCIKYATILL
jgi:hypothetical protein